MSVRLAGRLLEMKARPGDEVRVGDILGYVDSEQVSQIEADAIKAAARLESARAHEERERRVYEEQIARPKALIAARTAYERAKIKLASAKRDHHRVESLFKEKIAAAKEFYACNAAMQTAELELQHCQNEQAREEELFKNTGLLKKDWQLASAESRRCLNELNTSKERLKFLGVDDTTIEALIAHQRLSPLIPIVSAAAGTVVQQFVAPGEMVGPDKPIVSICNMSSVAVTCELPEADVAIVRKGLPVEARAHSYGDRVFEGRVNFVGSRLDSETRTIPVRAVIENSQRMLKLNMFVEVDLHGATKRALLCPRDAVHESGGHQVVYVRSAPSAYVEREIATGMTDDRYVEVLAGLQPGEEVVTRGSVLIKTQVAMEQSNK